MKQLTLFTEAFPKPKRVDYNEDSSPAVSLDWTNTILDMQREVPGYKLWKKHRLRY